MTISFHSTLHYDTSNHATPCSFLQHHATPHHITQYHFIQLYSTPYHTMSYLTTPCHTHHILLLRALEERTHGTIEKATSRLQDGDRKLKLADGKMLDLEQELVNAQVIPKDLDQEHLYFYALICFNPLFVILLFHSFTFHLTFLYPFLSLLSS